MYIFKHPFIANTITDKRCIMQLIEEKNAEYKKSKSNLSYMSVSTFKNSSLLDVKSMSVTNLNVNPSRFSQSVLSKDNLTKKSLPNLTPNRESVIYEPKSENLNDNLKRISKQIVKDICDEVIKSEYEVPSIPYIIYETLKELIELNAE
jgi:hypothetical protein